jgi:hypothetical protein
MYYAYKYWGKLERFKNQIFHHEMANQQTQQQAIKVENSPALIESNLTAEEIVNPSSSTSTPPITQEISEGEELNNSTNLHKSFIESSSRTPANLSQEEEEKFKIEKVSKTQKEDYMQNKECNDSSCSNSPPSQIQASTDGSLALGPPQPELSQTIKDDSNNYVGSRYYAEAGTNYSALDSKDKKSGALAHFYSKQNIFLNFTWLQSWGQWIKTFLGLTAAFESWDSSLSSGRTFDNKNAFTNGFYIGSQYYLTSQSAFDAKLLFNQDTFVRSANSASEIIFDHPMSAKAILNYSTLFAIKGPYSAIFKAGVSSYLPSGTSTHKIKYAPGYNFSLGLREDYSTTYIEAELYYEYQNSTTTLTTNVRQNLGLKLNYIFGGQRGEKK